MTKYLVVGLGRSGVSVANFLNKNENMYAVYDKDKKKAQDFIDKGLLPKNCEIVAKLCAKTLCVVQCIVLSPGVVLSKKVLSLVREYNIKVVGEMAFASTFCTAPIYAVTGTNGKTTTVNMLDSIFKKAKIRSHLVGNVGTPFSSVVDKIAPTDKVVCEVSSFQLEYSDGFKPSAVAITNIAPDHLDRYKTFDDYFDAKKIILERVGHGKIFLNFDDPLIRTLGENRKNCEYFSTDTLPKNYDGVFVKDKQIFYQSNGQENFIADLDKFKLLGEHNLSNLLCAVSLALYAGVGQERIQASIKGVKVPEHRIEYAGKINGALYFDDSKATNTSATEVAVSCFPDKKIWLLLGGSNKGESFKKFFRKLPQNVVRIVTFGKTGKRIARAAQKENRQGIFLCKNLYSAFVCAKERAKKNDVVLLSPACASFDEFANYRERGEYFKHLVAEYNDKNKD